MKRPLQEIDEQGLASIVFGTTADEYASDEQKDIDFFIDTRGHVSEESSVEEEEEEAAWVDDDDTNVDIQTSKKLRKLKEDYSEFEISSKAYEKRLRNQFQKLHPQPSWADISSSEQQEETVFSTTANLLKVVLNPEKLEVFRLKDANQMAYGKAVIQALEFHPSAPILLTAGFDKTLRLFQIDGKVNAKLQALHIKDMPIYSAHFTADGSQVIITGRRNFFYVYDLKTANIEKIHGIRGRSEKSFEFSHISPCNNYIVVLGRDGTIILISTKTKQWVGNLKMNGHVNCITFSADHQYLYALGSESKIYAFDLFKKECVGKYTDSGVIKPSAIACSPDNKWLATGSESGIVNLYKIDEFSNSSTLTPTKTILNLTTKITSLVFHPSSMLLAIASHNTKDALRLFHIPSLKMVKNWPTANTPLGYVSSVSFSPDKKFIAIGNAKGKALLYRLASF